MSMTLWTPRWKHEKPDATRCRVAVSDGGRSPLFHQCTKKAVVWHTGIGYCRQHNPEAVAERRRADASKWERDQQQNAQRQADAEHRAKTLGVGSAHYENSYGSRGGYTGGVILTPEEADQLIEELTRLRATAR